MLKGLIWNTVFIVVMMSGTKAACVEEKANVVPVLEWTRAGNEILMPHFSPDGTRIALVTRVHWPDGHEAEDTPNRFFKNLKQRQIKNPRFADPVIELLDMKGKSLCTTQYGWNPRIASDNTTLVYADQVKPITGLRMLAQTMEGNKIRLYDCKKKQSIEIAQPKFGYLDTPLFSMQDGTIVYSINEAINGAFGGPVAIDKIETNKSQWVSLIPKQNVPAVPCPPKDAVLSGKARFLCDKVQNLQSSFPRLVYHFDMVGNDVLALLGTPQPSAGDMYLAEHYDVDLVSFSLSTGKSRTIVSKLGNSARGTSFQAISGTEVLIFSQYWRRLSLQDGKWLADSEPHNTNPKSYYSHDGKYYLVDEECDQNLCLTLKLALTGKVVAQISHTREIYEVTWSDDSKFFAVVNEVDGTKEEPHKELLTVYRIQ